MQGLDCGYPEIEAFILSNVDVIVLGDFPGKYPDIARRLLKLFDRANGWNIAHKDSAIAIYSKELPFLPYEAVEALYFKNPRNIALNDTMIGALQDTYNFLVQEKIVPANKNIKDFYNNGFAVYE